MDPQKRKGQQNTQKRNKDDRTTTISKQMSYLLRHGAVKEGLKISEDGWVLLDDLLRHKQVANKKVTIDEVKALVENNDKQRFALKTENNQTWIKANQAHSMSQVKVVLTPVLTIDQIPSGKAIHGTYLEAWNTIKVDGLNRMKRHHIHFAIGEPQDNEVISGMRSSAQVLIYLDLEKALKDNVPLFISENKVILSPGLNGIIAPEYFKCVLDKSGNLLYGSK